MKLAIKGFRVDAANPWDAGQVRQFCNEAVILLGGEGAWKLLTPRLQEAVLAERVLRIASGNNRSIPVGSVIALHRDMCRMMGLQDDGDGE